MIITTMPEIFWLFYIRILRLFRPALERRNWTIVWSVQHLQLKFRSPLLASQVWARDFDIRISDLSVLRILLFDQVKIYFDDTV
jgi:hypothetical protein